MTVPPTGSGHAPRDPVPTPTVPEGFGPLLDALRERGVAVLFVERLDADAEGVTE